MSAALDLMHALVLEDGQRWGAVAAPFQLEDAAAVLETDGPPYHFLTRSRGSSKTGDLAGVAIAAMLAQLPRGARLYGLAADRDQGRLLVDSIAGFAARTPELRGALAADTFKVTATRSGSVLEAIAADAASSWGLRPAFLIVDELAQWASTPGPRRLWEATTSAVAKVAAARLVVLTTAGDPSHWSRAVLEHAHADPLWRVREVPGPAPWLDAPRLEEQRRRLPESSFRRLFLNEWVAAEDRLIDPDALRACVTLDGPLPPRDGARYVVAADLGLKRDRTALVVAHGERVERAGETTGLRVVLDRLEAWQGSKASPVQLADVEAWIVQASDAFNRAPVILDPWQAAGLAQRLRSRGIRVEEHAFTAQSVGRLASTLHLLLRDGLLALPPDEELLDELANVRLRETSPGVYRMDHDADRHDDRAVALALAAHHLVERGARISDGGAVAVVRSVLDRPAAPDADAEIAAFHRRKAERERRRELRAAERAKIPIESFDPRFR